MKTLAWGREMTICGGVWRRWLAIGLVASVGTIAHATDAPAPVDAFARSSPISSPRLSPDGNYLAVSADYQDGNHALLVYRIADMKAMSMLRFPLYEMASDIVWVSDRRLVIAKGRKYGSLETPQPTGDIIATDMDGSRQKYIYGYEQTTRSGGLARGFGYIAGVPQVRNGHFYMRQYAPDSTHSALYDVDADNATHRLIADVDAPDMGFVIDNEGKPRFATGVDSNDQPILLRADDKGRWSPMSDALRVRWQPFSFSRDGTHVFGYNAEGGPASLVISDTNGDNQKVLASDPTYSIYDLQWTNLPAEPFAARLGQGKPRMQFFAAGAEADLYKALSAALPGHYVDLINYSTDGNRVLVRLYSDRDAGGWYLFDRRGNKLDPLFLERKELLPARMSERRMIRFAASDGLMLDAVLTVPNDAKADTPLPMVLLPHGGPHAYGDGWGFDTDAQFLASRGYLVLQVNYRGGLGRGRDFQRAGYLQWGEHIQQDLIDGVRWSIAQRLADPARICVYGGSFGAYSAMMVSAREPNMFRCAIGIAGIYDLKMMYKKGDIKDSEYGRNYLQRVIGRDDADLVAHSPTTLASRITVPVLLVHGQQDQRAPLAQAKAMRVALEKSGNRPEWMSVPKEGHGFYKDENNIAFYRELETFLARNLGAAPAAATAGTTP
jgi:dipeptidyl aminopeptidase/acylaminoacyl peptidase